MNPEAQGQPTPEELTTEQPHPIESLFYIAEELGFAESETTSQIREQIQELAEADVEDFDEEAFRELLTEYYTLNNALVDQIPKGDPKYITAQIGSNIALARVLHAAHKFAEYRQAMEHAMTQARNFNLPNLEETLEEIKDAAFTEDIRSGFSELVDLVEIIPDQLLSLDPYNLRKFEDRSLQEMSPREVNEVHRVMSEILGIELANLEVMKVGSYSTETGTQAKVPGIINIDVFKTGIEGVFLHQLTSPDGQVDYSVGAEGIQLSSLD